MINLIVILLIVQLIFSIWPILIKLVISEGYNPLLLAIARDLFASKLLWICVWYSEGHNHSISEESHHNDSNQLNNRNVWEKLSKTSDLAIDKFNQSTNSIMNTDRSIIILFILLGIASTINSVGYVIALQFVSPLNSSLFHPAVPVFTVIIGTIFGVEILNLRKVIGVILCVVGSFVIVLAQIWGQTDDKLSYSLFGNILLILQGLAMSFLLVGQKFLPNNYSSVLITAIYYSIGTMISLPICLTILIVQGQLHFMGLSASLVCIFGAVFVISFNYSALAWANKASSPAIPASSMMCQPPLTYLLSALLLDGPVPGGLELIGTASIFSGLIITVFPSTRGNSVIDDIPITNSSSDEEAGIMLLGGYVVHNDYFVSDDKTNVDISNTHELNRPIRTSSNKLDSYGSGYTITDDVILDKYDDNIEEFEA